MNGAKIRLSQAEMELAVNAEVILTKNAIIQKAIQLLGMLQEKQQAWIGNHGAFLPARIRNSSPKISKGENYMGLPYLVLDYPRCFDKEDVFLMRAMFWWGNFFSVTLHISGVFANQFAKIISKNRNKLSEHRFYICVQEDPWQHHFLPDNFRSIHEMDSAEFENFIGERSFIKLAKQIPLTAWEDAVTLMETEFEMLIEVLQDQLPSR